MKQINFHHERVYKAPLIIASVAMLIAKGRRQNKKTSYRMTLSLLPLTPLPPNLIVTSLESDKVVFPRPPRPPERVTISVTLGGILGT